MNISDERIRFLIARPYAQRAAAAELAAHMSAGQTIDTLYRKVSTAAWNEIMQVLEQQAAEQIAEQIDEYQWEQNH
ncbi:hypothetical protein, partial [Kingella potus]